MKYNIIKRKSQKKQHKKAKHFFLRSTLFIIMISVFIATQSRQIPTVFAAPGDISGNVFRDFNADGANDAGEPGIGNITVKAYDASGTTVATTTSVADGTYTLSGLTIGTDYRVEFTLPIDGSLDFYNPSAIGIDHASSVQFVTGGSSSVDAAFVNPAEYAQPNPQLAIAQFINGDASATTPSDAVKRFDYNRTSISTIAHKVDIGSTWGLAWARESNTLYAAAFLKRHVGVGPDGLGAIYKIPDANATSGTPSLFFDLATVSGVSVGTIPNNATRGLTTPLAPSHDVEAFDKVGKVGLGDIDISEDESTLWVVSLNDKTLYEIVIDADGNPATSPTASDVTGHLIPDPGCTDGAWRPFGLKTYQGNVYVGGVCDAQTSGFASDLHAYVYQFDGASFTNILDFSLDYSKGYTGSACATDPGWYAWTSTWHMCSSNASVAAHPQPVLSDIEFDVDGDMILGFLDRYGHQIGPQNYNLSGGSSGWPFTGGDVLRADYAGGVYTLENNATVGSTTTAGAGNNQGPGGGEYYYGENFADNHRETSNGALALLFGSGETLVTVLDPVNIWEGGVGWFDNQAGSKLHGYVVYSGGQQPYFGKAHGIGDLELLADPAPVEIGNRVWLDMNNDGIQDPGEPGVERVVVGLYDNVGVLVATVLTDSDGTYVFSSDMYQTDQVGRNYGLALDFHDTYTVALLESNFNTSGTLAGQQLTQANAEGNTSNDPLLDVRDSDHTSVSVGAGSNAASQGVAITLQGGGKTNHGLDFGITYVRIGDYVWNDQNGNGLQDMGESGISGVVVTLHNASGTPVMACMNTTGDYRDEGSSALTGTTTSNSSHGTLDWSGQSWSIQGGFVNAGAGNPPSSYLLRQGTVASINMQRAVDLSVFAANPTLTLDYIYNNATSHVVQYSTDGGTTWNTLATIASTDGSGYQPLIVPIPSLAANAMIRIAGNDTVNVGNSALYVDNIKVEGCLPEVVTTTTDVNGLYSFDTLTGVLPSTNYQVRIDTTQTPLAGLGLTIQDAGGVASNDPVADNTDSDAAMSGTDAVISSAFSPASGENLSYDFGFTTVAIGDYVWHDTNGDGLQDGGELGIENVRVTLHNADGTPVIACMNTVGNYLDDGGSNNASSGTLDWSGQSWTYSGGAAFLTPRQQPYCSVGCGSVYVSPRRSVGLCF